MDELLIKYKCTACGQAVLNRRINHCLYCGAMLPADCLFSDDKIARLDKEESNRNETRIHSHSEQIIRRQSLFRELVDDADGGRLESQTKLDERSDGIRAMDAIIGGVIGFVISFLFGLVLFKSGHFSELRMSLFVVIVVGATLLGTIGSWLNGTEFWTRFFLLFKKK